MHNCLIIHTVVNNSFFVHASVRALPRVKFLIMSLSCDHLCSVHVRMLIMNCLAAVEFLLLFFVYLPRGPPPPPSYKAQRKDIFACVFGVLCYFPADICIDLHHFFFQSCLRFCVRNKTNILIN